MSNYPTLQLNDTGNYVKIAQQLLKILNLYPASITGSFDTTTENAVISFQQINNLPITGVINSETWELLIDETKNDNRSMRIEKTLELNSEGNEVKELQNKLKTLLYYDGDITGYYDTELENAVKTFQVNNKILASGITDSQTWNTINQTYSALANCSQIDIPAQTEEYIVKKGDTLYSIAKKFDTTIDVIKNINNLSTNVLIVGQTILIPKTSDDSNKNEINYTVKKGDTLYSISKAYNISIDDLKKANNLNTNTLSIGQILKIPNNTNNYISYTVKKGDTLYSIANKFNISITELMNLNNLSNSILSIGQNLIIPQSDEYRKYIVKSGDTLYSISKLFGVSVDSIKKLNNLTSNVLSINQSLLIPN